MFFDIKRIGKFPIFVGGRMMYFNFLLYGKKTPNLCPDTSQGIFALV